MKQRKKQIVVVSLAVLGLYLGAYAHVRATQQIVHLENRSEGRDLVIARTDAWDRLLVDMSAGKPVVEALAETRMKTPALLNTVFWPLRWIESAWWNLNNPNRGP